MSWNNATMVHWYVAPTFLTQRTSPCSRKFPTKWWRLSFPYPLVTSLSDYSSKTHPWKKIGQNCSCYLQEHRCAVKESYPLHWLDLNPNSPCTFTPSYPFQRLARCLWPIPGTEQQPRNQRGIASSLIPLFSGTSRASCSWVFTLPGIT